LGSDLEASEGEYEQVRDDELDPNIAIQPDPDLTNAIKTANEKVEADKDDEYEDDENYSDDAEEEKYTETDGKEEDVYIPDDDAEEDEYSMD
jgi:hypothetical protein